MLTGKLTLHDIQDAEAFTARLIPDGLNHHDREDIHAYLVETAWELSLTYRPGGITFSTYAGTTLRQRVHDWTRTRNGRTKWTFAGHTYTRVIPELVSYEHESAGHNPTQNDRPSDRLARALPQTHRDPAADSASDSDWLHGTRGSDEAWRAHTRRPRLPRRAA